MSKLLYVSCSHGRTQVSDIGHEGGTRVSKGASSVHSFLSCHLDPGSPVARSDINLTSLMIVHTIRSLTRLTTRARE